MCKLNITHLTSISVHAHGQTELVEGEEHEHSITSRINLVDLAGSERSNTAQTSGDRLRVCTHTHTHAHTHTHTHTHTMLFLVQM